MNINEIDKNLKTIDCFRRYVKNLECKLDCLYTAEIYNKDDIEQEELLLKMFNSILKLLNEKNEIENYKLSILNLTNNLEKANLEINTLREEIAELKKNKDLKIGTDFIKVDEFGIDKRYKGYYARTNDGIIGIIANTNEGGLLLGPELISPNRSRLYCIERNSIIKIEDSWKKLIGIGDIIEYVDSNQKTTITLELVNNKLLESINNLDIISVLTKEEFKNNKFNDSRREYNEKYKITRNV